MLGERRRERVLGGLVHNELAPVLAAPVRRGNGGVVLVGVAGHAELPLIRIAHERPADRASPTSLVQQRPAAQQLLADEVGKHISAGLISLSILIIVPALTFLFGGVTLNFQYPELNQLSDTIYNFKGGVSIIPELISLALALSMYTATFVAENVRAGIEGVGKGQKEAAASIGLTRGQILKLVVMPQALRIIIPPTTNQYLNLTKNSSLAAAIAYPDLVLVFAGTALMQTGRAIEIISITMGTQMEPCS